jgi:hypothetical protein
MGTPPPYTFNSSCDNVFIGVTEAMDTAFASGIMVVASTGNDGSSDKIALPACIKNVTAVGATNKDDTIATYGNRNNITDLVAPGTDINSTIISGGYGLSTGTSMATPHVSGAAALVYHYLKQANKAATPANVELVLKQTGKQIYDSSNGIWFSRIDVFSAIVALNESSVINLINPLNNTVKFSKSVVFQYNVSDDYSNISNCSLYFDNTLNQTDTTVEEATTQNFTSTLTNGNYYWHVQCYNDIDDSFESDEWFFKVTLQGGGGGGGRTSGSSGMVMSQEQQPKNETPKPGLKATDIGNLQYNNVTVNASENESFKFLVKNKSHEAKIISITSSQVVLLISSNPLQVEINLGETKQVDTDANGLNDLAINFNSVTDGKASLSFSELKEISGVVTQTAAQEKKRSMWPVIIIALVAIAGIIFFLRTRAKKLRYLGYK